MQNPIEKIKHNLLNQDNRITAHPLFAVERKCRLATDPDCDCNGYLWIDSDECEEADERETRILDKLSERHFMNEFEKKEKNGRFYKWYYQEIWEFVTACLTEQGCKDYIKLNGHNLGETRIYAYSGYRNEEMIALRQHLMTGKDTPAYHELRTVRLLAKKYNKLGAEQKDLVANLKMREANLFIQYKSAIRQLHAYAEKFTEWKPSHGWDLPPYV